MPQATSQGAALQQQNNLSQYVQQFYSYAAVPQAAIVGDAAQGVGAFTTDGGSRFMVDALAFDAFDANGVPFEDFTDRRVLVQIADSLSSSTWSNALVPVQTVFGSAREPFYLPASRMIGPSVTVSVAISQIDVGGATVSYYFNFIGRKLFARAN